MINGVGGGGGSGDGDGVVAGGGVDVLDVIDYPPPSSGHPASIHPSSGPPAEAIVDLSYVPQHPLPPEIGALPRDDTVCKFCGVSYLILNEIKKLEEKLKSALKEIERLEGAEEKKEEEERKRRLAEEVSCGWECRR